MRGLIAVISLAVAIAAPLPAALGQGLAVGERIEVRVQDLPPPRATPSVANPPRPVARPANASLKLPPGFHANIFADGLHNARIVHVTPNGDVLVAETRLGRIMILRDADGDGRAEVLRPFAEGLDLPHALVIRDGWLYVGEVGQVRKLPYRAGELFPLGTPQWVTPPRSLAPNGGGGHPTRSLAFAPDGAEFFVGIGSRGNVADEPIPYASVQRFAADGSGQRTFAAGLRNPIGLAIRPGSNEVWALVNERDGLGDGLVPDYLTRVDDGAFYGWPFAYSGANPDPDFGARRPDLVAQSRLPDLLFQAHSAPIALAFYDGAQFPPDYRGDAIVTLHGSWNSSRPAGYLIARVPFANGKPKGYYEVFATGFWASGSTTAEVWGRPAGIAVAKDGALLVADDLANVIWRISYRP